MPYAGYTQNSLPFRRYPGAMVPGVPFYQQLPQYPAFAQGATAPPMAPAATAEEVEWPMPRSLYPPPKWMLSPREERQQLADRSRQSAISALIKSGLTTGGQMFLGPHKAVVIPNHLDLRNTPMPSVQAPESFVPGFRYANPATEWPIPGDLYPPALPPQPSTPPHVRPPAVPRQASTSRPQTSVSPLLPLGGRWDWRDYLPPQLPLYSASAAYDQSGVPRLGPGLTQMPTYGAGFRNSPSVRVASGIDAMIHNASPMGSGIRLRRPESEPELEYRDFRRALNERRFTPPTYATNADGTPDMTRAPIAGGAYGMTGGDPRALVPGGVHPGGMRGGGYGVRNRVMFDPAEQAAMLRSQEAQRGGSRDAVSAVPIAWTDRDVALPTGQISPHSKFAPAAARTADGKMYFAPPVVEKRPALPPVQTAAAANALADRLALRYRQYQQATQRVPEPEIPSPSDRPVPAAVPAAPAAQAPVMPTTANPVVPISTPGLASPRGRANPVISTPVIPTRTVDPVAAAMSAAARAPSPAAPAPRPGVLGFYSADTSRAVGNTWTPEQVRAAVVGGAVIDGLPPADGEDRLAYADRATAEAARRMAAGEMPFIGTTGDAGKQAADAIARRDDSYNAWLKERGRAFAGNGPKVQATAFNSVAPPVWAQRKMNESLAASVKDNGLMALGFDRAQQMINPELGPAMVEAEAARDRSRVEGDVARQNADAYAKYLEAQSKLANNPLSMLAQLLAAGGETGVPALLPIISGAIRNSLGSLFPPGSPMSNTPASATNLSAPRFGRTDFWMPDGRVNSDVVTSPSVMDDIVSQSMESARAAGQPFTMEWLQESLKSPTDNPFNEPITVDHLRSYANAPGTGWLNVHRTPSEQQTAVRSLLAAQTATPATPQTSPGQAPAATPASQDPAVATSSPQPASVEYAAPSDRNTIRDPAFMQLTNVERGDVDKTAVIKRVRGRLGPTIHLPRGYSRTVSAHFGVSPPGYEWLYSPSGRKVLVRSTAE